MAQSGVPIQLSGADCRLVRPLGEGSAGTVYCVEIDGAPFALKVANLAGRDALASEAERLLLCASLHLPRVHDVGELPAAFTHPGMPRGAPYLLRSYAPGSDLRRIETEDRELVAHALLRDVGEALADLHRAGVAHGDVKPANVVAHHDERGWHCALIDLGLADAVETALPRGATPRYLPPELKAGKSSSSDGRSRDLWALGLTLLEVLVPEARASESPLDALEHVPPGYRHVVRALLRPNPAARASAEWVTTQVVALGGFDRQAAEHKVEQSYVAFRKRELLRVARGYRFRVDVVGPAGEWLGARCELLARVAKLRGVRGVDSETRFDSLTAGEQRRWLLGLIGISIVDFPPFPAESDATLSSRLLQLAATTPPEAFTFSALYGLAPPHTEVVPDDTVDLALCLGQEAPSNAVLTRAERAVFRGEATNAFALQLARAFKRRNAPARALSVLDHATGGAARLEQANVAARLGDADEALCLLETLFTPETPRELSTDARALAARLHLQRGDITLAAQQLEGTCVRFSSLEARTALELTRGNLEAAKGALEAASSWAHNAEERARLEALHANWSQQSGASREALQRFLKAAEHAARAGALLEEATYLIGVASTATNVGQLSAALASADRSALLFEYLHRPDAAARAVLSKANALAALGAHAEAESSAALALRLAKQGNDPRCQGFAHLLLCDVLPRAEAVEHVQRAATLLEGGRSEDLLHLAARRLRWGLITDVSATDRGALAEPSAEARVEWWGERARAALEATELQHAEPIVLALTQLTQSDAPVAARGPSFTFGAQLAARLGDGEAARRLGAAASAALRTLTDGVSPDRRAALLALEWTIEIRPPEGNTVAPEQLGDIETLIHSLSERGNLRALLDRVLDALIRWTSVERGLLLLTAPGGQLKPRAARNLARKDLVGDQLRLSMSLAEQALASRDCVIAMDATGELPSAHTSVHALKLRSVLAVPLIARGEVLGVVYLDDRMRAGAFGKRELGWVRLVSSLAAVAVADARDQLLLRRAVRKARSAESKVTQLLAKREAALLIANQALARTRGRQTRFDYDAIVGESAPIQELLQLVDRVVPSDIPVLVLGASGSGKELIARAIHKNGPRREGPFVSENCSAIPEALLESTLFGHVKGAFTGASRHHAGLLEVAHGGTLFLDEIADMSLGMQAKLLRCLENGEIRRVGSERTMHVDVRVIGATHKQLEQMVQARLFREDLYYRLNVITLHVPALAERRADIPLLVRHFLNKYAANRKVDLAPGVLDELCSLPWPGNVRQLENEVRRALVLADDEIRHEHLTTAFSATVAGPGAEGLNLRARLDALETQLVKKALTQTLGNQTKAAQVLGVSRFGLQKMIRRLEIDVARGAPVDED
jgi:serine/threonine-protein kinase PknK